MVHNFKTTIHHAQACPTAFRAYALLLLALVHGEVDDVREKESVLAEPFFLCSHRQAPHVRVFRKRREEFATFARI